MSKLSTKKINIADYSKANTDDIAKLARSLNPLMDDLERILRKGGLSVADNLPFEYQSFDVSVDASGNPLNRIQLTSSLTTTIKGVIVVDVTNSNTYPTSAPFVAVSITNSLIEVKKVFGLPANTTFKVTVMVVS